MAGFSTEGIMPVMPYGMGNNSGDGFGFGNGGGWIVFLIIAMMFGWGGNGFGGRGMNNFTGGEVFGDQFALQDLKNGQRQIDSGIRGIERGISDSTFGLKDSISNLGTQLSSCCCETNRNIDSVRYDMAKGFCDVINANAMNTRDILESNCQNTQRILDAMNQNTIQDLRDKNNSLTLQLSQQAQTSAIIGAVRPTPIPAYPVCSPYESLYNPNKYGVCGCNQ